VARCSRLPNGAMESFFSSLKQEEIYRTSYRSVQDFKKHIAEYMEFYNEKRPHRANNYKTPNQAEKLFYQRKKNHDV
jgi:transposase InsO family protein